MCQIFFFFFDFKLSYFIMKVKGIHSPRTLGVVDTPNWGWGLRDTILKMKLSFSFFI